MSKKRILIIGPIVDFGGREVMTNLLVKALSNNYEITVLSTVTMTNKSIAVKGLKTNQWDVVSSNIFRNNLYIRITSLLTKLVHKRTEPAYFFIKNKLTKSFFNFSDLYADKIKTFIRNNDLIIYSDEINGKWLDYIIQHSQSENKPVVLRLTGQIKCVPNTFLNKNLGVLAHSKQNLKAIEEALQVKVWNIDQTSALETELLSLNIEINQPIVYGFLGRFSPEKGINELLETFIGAQRKLVIAGKGPLLNKVIESSNKNENISFIGELKQEEVPAFFNKIDVFIIPSLEEGGPVVGVEAMAAGKLIISTKVGAMPERMLGTNNDFWFSHEDINSFQSVIDRVEKLNKSEIEKISHELREKYISHNSFKSIQTKYISLIETMFNLSN